MMKKVQTIFDRDWDGDRKCIDLRTVNEGLLSGCFATEKIDGTNIRLTIRNGEVVRVEKRRNPSKQQKKSGITNPWYVDALETGSQDKWIYDAVRSTDFSHIIDGEFSAEAFGKNIQGNPLNMDGNQVFVFGYYPDLDKIRLYDVPLDYSELKDYILNSHSNLNPKSKIEGIVWHNVHGDMFKIKAKDFQIN